jgi:hypothetical protein
MAILNIRPVSREVAKVIVGLASTSGGGKTYTALQLALGLSGGDPGKIGFLDTESGRGALYDEIFSKPYMIADLAAPFSPKRYREALTEFSQSGPQVIIVDSMSHEWEGDGGCDEIAQAALLNGKKMADWIGAKREHHKFMRTLLALPCHLVLCFRAREKTDFRSDPRAPKSLGIQPICEKNVMYEMTVSFMLENGGRNRTALKEIPSFFRFLDGDGYLSTDHGAKMLAWFGKSDHLEMSRKSLKFAAGRGTEALKEAWLVLAKPVQKELGAFKDTLKDLAAHADSEKLMRVPGELNDDERAELARLEAEGKL